MDDPYLNNLKNEFREYSGEIKTLQKKLLKSNLPEEQSMIIKKIDIIAKEMEKNQRQAAKVTKSRLKEKTKSNRASRID
ncbi:MAG: hypothetical protein K8Q89_02255 [Nitrosarchaeum sp.]|nr:hypothetical protein [Nitrosarchaeum sp.]